MSEYEFNSKSDVRQWLSDISERWDQKQYVNWDMFFDDTVDMIWNFYDPCHGISELTMDNILTRHDDSEILEEGQ